MHPDDDRDALQMLGDRRSGRSKIKAIVFDAEMQIKMAAEEKPVSVGKRILDGRLVAEASAPAQVALEDVTRFDLNDVERNLGRLRIQKRLDHRFLGAFRETFEHGHYLPGRNRRPACFLWTACLLTLSS